MVTIDNEHIYITDDPGADPANKPISSINDTDYTVIAIRPTKHDRNYKKELKSVNIPKTGGEEPETYIFDLNRVGHTFTITGVLTDESGTSAVTKANTLVDLVETANTKLYMVRGTGSEQMIIEGVIAKAKISEDYREGAVVESGSISGIIAVWNVTLTFEEGVNRLL